MASTSSLFLERALVQILNERDVKRVQNARLKQACEKALGDVRTKPQPSRNETDGNERTSAITAGRADAYFLPLELACKSRSPKIVGTALDCLQKLIAPGHLQGCTPDPDDSSKFLVDRIVDTVCTCFHGVNTDEDVQLQIIKALLTMVTAPTCEVHEAALLQVVRTCYNIYLASRNPINQMTAKSTLTQMLAVIFQRMEQEADRGVSEVNHGRQMSTPCPSTGGSSQTTTPSHIRRSAGPNQRRLPAGEETDEEAEKAYYGDAEENGEYDDHSDKQRKVVNGRGKADSPEMNKSRQDSGEPRPPVHDTSPGDPEPAGSHDNGTEGIVRQVVEGIVDIVLNEVESDYAMANQFLHRKGSPPPLTPMTVIGPGTLVGMGADAFSDSDSSNALSSQKNRRETGFRHILQKDAFLVFRSLCKLSMKTVESHDPRSHELRSKVLSLELMLSILENSGPTFRSSNMFINAIKQYLCVALSKNGVSSVPQVFELSLAIFLTLLRLFKVHLKMQIEVFFKEIFLNILHSASSSFQLKCLVVKALAKICSDAQCVVDIFLNYDCDLSLANIFEQLIGDISHVAQRHNVAMLGNLTSAQEKTIQLLAMQCLVSILRCLMQWSSDLYAPVSTGPTTTSAFLESAFPLSASAKAGIERGQRIRRPSKGELSDSSSHQSQAPTPVVERSGEFSQPAMNDISEDEGVAQDLSRSSSSSKGGLDNPEEFEVIKRKKDLMEQGLVTFEKSPKKGITFLQQEGLLGADPDEVAYFFHSDSRVDPVAIGEFIGDVDKYCIDVMYAYVDQLDFSEMEFVPALRLFLSGFRLPGEAQKIDRLMEKFAGRYCQTNPNPELFASADTAYVLAYSIIMLATDLHSSKIKRENKMTKEQYIKMNRGINDQKDLPSEYLESIYDEIAKQEITLRASSRTIRNVAVPVATEKERQERYMQEMEVMSQTAKAMMEGRSHIQTSFTSATRREHVKPMFKLAWTPFLAALSLALRESDMDDIEMVRQCLEGFRHAIRVASIFNMSLERNAYVQSLAKFTLLTTTGGLSEMRPKNVETIKTLITVAHTEGNNLQESWHDILCVVSHLELAQLVTAGIRPYNGTPNSTVGGITTSRESANLDLLESTWGKVDQRTLASFQESMDDCTSQSVLVAVDRLFTSSSLLSGDAIVHFVRGLCEVSMAELQNKSTPRMYSLQKIVEISYYNMARIRLEWSRIWAVLGDHFNKVGCSSNEDVSVFALDSLRQLSMKFLERGELPNFRFQKDFLRPFEYIMKRSGSWKIRDMVVSCMAQMVHIHSANIKSGWENIFAVFHLAASDHEEQIVELAFQTTSNIFEKHFAATTGSFQDAVKCLSEFACNAAFPDSSMEAIRLIDTCAHHIAKCPEMFGKERLNDDPADGQDRVWVNGWFPVLFELSCIVNRCKLDVRTRALTVLFNLIKSFGHSFACRWWLDLFSVIFRLFDNMKLPEQQMEKAEWMTTTCPHALMAIVDVFTQFFNKLAPALLDDLYSQFTWSAQQDNKEMATVSLDCLESFVTSNGASFNEQQWEKTIDCIQKVFDQTTPSQLLTWRAVPAAVRGGDDMASLTPPVPICIPRKALQSVSAADELSPVINKVNGGSESLASQCSGSEQLLPDVIAGAVTEDVERELVESEVVPVEHSLSVAAIDGSNVEESIRAHEIAQQRLFVTLQVRCLVQRSLIRAIDHILFSSTMSKQEDTRLYYAAAAQAAHLPTLPSSSPGPNTANSTPVWSPTYIPQRSLAECKQVSGLPKDAMLPRLTARQLLQLVHVLMGTHDFAKTFNSDNEQRTALWKAGFMGKSKPNMWAQETESLLCILRVLFRMHGDPKFNSCLDMIEETLITVWRSAVTYYCSVVAENHRNQWSPVLLLLFHHFQQLEPDRFDRHLLHPGASVIFGLATVDMKPALCCAYRDLLEQFHARACRLLSAQSSSSTSMSTTPEPPS